MQPRLHRKAGKARMIAGEHQVVPVPGQQVEAPELGCHRRECLQGRVGPAFAANEIAHQRAARTRRRFVGDAGADRSEEHTSELQSLMRISYAVFCLKTKKTTTNTTH